MKHVSTHGLGKGKHICTCRGVLLTIVLKTLTTQLIHC